jgi:exodeoxyribonuclease VII large subunit
MNDYNILSVGELTHLIKNVLEDSFTNLNIIGELSNFKSHVSGHWYFTLKDSEAQISCTMWKGINNYVFFTPQDGMKVIITGKITVYPPRGNYQIDVRSMKPAGVGDLQLAFEKLKEKLFDEGLFDESHKKNIPSFPLKIGLVTSIGSAAIKDMISVAKRKFPLVELIISPCKVQGSDAALSIVNAIRNLNIRKDIDVIIVARGGGSLEDLWAFNEEIVAREIFASVSPVITGIGHEVDFTISDFVSDLRAATPTAAMEAALPDKLELINGINEFNENSFYKINDILEINESMIERILSSAGFRIPLDMARIGSQTLDGIIFKLNLSIDKIISLFSHKLKILSTIVNSNDINKSLKRGFVLVKQGDKFVMRLKNFNVNKAHSLLFYDGALEIKKER